jgi:hypothetical protein
MVRVYRYASVLENKLCQATSHGHGPGTVGLQI